MSRIVADLRPALVQQLHSHPSSQREADLMRGNCVIADVWLRAKKNKKTCWGLSANSIKTLRRWNSILISLAALSLLICFSYLLPLRVKWLWFYAVIRMLQRFRNIESSGSFLSWIVAYLPWKLSIRSRRNLTLTGIHSRCQTPHNTRAHRTNHGSRHHCDYTEIKRAFQKVSKTRHVLLKLQKHKIRLTDDWLNVNPVIQVSYYTPHNIFFAYGTMGVIETKRNLWGLL